jgi:hypothetical protein
MTARDDARQAGAEAAAVLSAAQKAILEAMTSAAARVSAGVYTPQQGRRKVRITTAAALGAASKRLQAVYGTAVRQVTGETGPLPDAPGQVAAAVLRAQQDADVAMGAVLAAMGAEGSRMPPPSSPYRQIVSRAQRGTGPGLPAARAALAAITARGLTGYVSQRGRRWPLGAYGERAVRTATAQLAKAPFTSEITARREALLAQHVTSVTHAWNEAVKGLDASSAVAAFRRDSRTASAAGDAGLARRWRQEAASAAAQGWLAGVYQASGYRSVASSLEDTVRDGMAEGEADAMAAAAYQQRLGRFDTDAAFAAALATLQGDYGVTRQAQEAAAALIAGAAADAARALAGTDDDSGEEEAAEALKGAVSGSGISAVARWVERALFGAFGAGSIALWRRAAAALGGLFGSVELISWDTDSSPCVLCSENASDGPYLPQDVPPYLAHPNCRCSLSSAGDVPSSWLASFLG